MSDAPPPTVHPEISILMLGMELAWGIIANAYGGDWDKASPDWKEAAEKWRDEQWGPALSQFGYSRTPEELAQQGADSLVPPAPVPRESHWFELFRFNKPRKEGDPSPLPMCLRAASHDMTESYEALLTRIRDMEKRARPHDIQRIELRKNGEVVREDTFV